MRPNQKPSLLPSYSSAFERALASLEPDLAALDQATRELATIFDPAQTPEKFLPFLAWDFSVDSWSPHWDEATRRKVIAASWIVHRYKGTRPAILAATEALGYSVEIVEWFDQMPEGEAGTFEIIQWVELQNMEALLERARQADFIKTVERSAPLSRPFSLSFGIPVVVEPKLSAVAAVDVSEGHLAEVTDECSLNLPFASAAWGECEEELGVVRDDFCATLSSGAAFYGEITIDATPPSAAQ